MSNDNPLRQFFPYGPLVHAHDPEGQGLKYGRALADAIERTCQDVAAHHMNCVWASGLAPWLSGHAALEQFLPLWLESGRRHGLRVIAQGGFPPSLVKPGVVNGKAEFIEVCQPYYRDMARKYRADETLLAWSITEEIELVEWFYQGVAELTEKMAQWDPNHPMIMLDNRASSGWLNANMVKPKALCRDVYPFFADGINGPYQPMGFRSMLTRECRRFREAAQTAGGIFWIMGQCMSLADTMFVGENFTYRYPTPAEARWQVWTAIQEGAKGSFFYTYRFLPPSDMFIHEGMRDHDGNETEQYRTLAELGRHLKPLMPVILELDIAKPHQDVIYWENGPVSGQTFVQRRTGRRFLVAVNHDCDNIQPFGIELGYWCALLRQDEKVFDLRNRRKYEYQELKLGTLLPGDGTIFLVGTDTEWEEFAGKFYE